MTARAANTGRMEPHQEQTTAARPDASVWVSASAGSGKTKVLADRVLRLLLAGTRPERILCLTFTRAAAAEMQNRIRGLLGRWAAESGDALASDIGTLVGAAADESALERARGLFAEVLEAPGGIGIMTIHAFCQSLLSRFPLEAGVVPHFEVMDERETAEAIAEARDSVLTLADGETGLSLAAGRIMTLVGERDFLELLGGVTRERGRIRRLLDDSGGRAGAAERTRRALGLAEGETVRKLLARFCARDTDHLWTVAAGLLGRYAGTLSEEELRALADDGNGSAGATDRRNARAVMDWIGNPAPESFDDYALVYLTRAGEPRRRLGPPKSLERMPRLEETLRDEAAEVHEVAKRRKAIRTATSTGDLLVVADAILAHYERHKRRRAVLDYDDLILRARALVERAAPWVMFKLDGGIDHVLIDEAQDTNADEWAIVGAITEEFFSGEGARDTRRTVFAVGDEKQSIFGFQGAAPDEFARMKELVSGRAADAGLPWEEVPLARSYRSVPPVLRAVDIVFAGEAAKGVSAVPVSHVSHRGGQAGLVEVWPPVMPPEDGGKASWEFPALPDQRAPEERLARAIADRIAAWIRTGERLPGRARPIRAGDVMVLVRRRSAFIDHLMHALKVRGIAVAGADRMVVADQLAVQDLVALAAFALLPEDDLNLAAVLKGPLVGFGEEQLFEACHGRSGRLWRALRNRAERDGDAARAVGLLTGLLDRADRTPPFEFLTHVLETLQGRARIVARLGEQANDPIDELLTLALFHERSQAPSLQGFLRWFAEGGAEIKRDLDRSDRDEVRILTVHGAKGLEAPIVFLPDTMRTPRADRGMLWGDAGDGEVMLWPPRASDRVEAAEAFAGEAKRRQDEEYRRLLYVAMTRAEDRLYVCGYGTRQKPPENCWYNLVWNGLADLAESFEFEAGDGDFGWTGTGLSLSSPQESAPDRREDPGAADAAVEDLPGWADEAAPDEPAPSRPLAPSLLDEREPAARSPLGSDRGRAFRRGLLIHHLLQMLPGVEPGARRGVARRFLESPSHGLDEDAIPEILEAAFGVLDHPDWQPLFGPGSRAEVPVAGVVDGTAISGRIDRLVVEPGRVRVLDFKTNRPAPRRVGDVPVGYLRQMAAYRALIAKVYENHEVECGLLWTDGPRLMTLDAAALAAAGP